MERTKSASGIAVGSLSAFWELSAEEKASKLLDQSMLLFVTGVAAAFAISITVYLHGRLAAVEATPAVLAFVFFKAGVEIWCSFYAGYFVFISVYYIATVGRDKKNHKPVDMECACPPLAIVYLCCNDIDETCLESLCRTDTNGRLKIIVHDDSFSEEEQKRVDSTVGELAGRYAVDMEVLRRGNREGGKPGALNYVLARIPAVFEWMLICDNDSMSTDPLWYRRVAGDLADRSLGVVQFRNAGDQPKAGGLIQRALHRSIDVFEVFVAPAERLGWLPFFGHNAILRLSAVREVGGFQPGEFADDIDMSVRLTLAGYRITYRNDISYSEAHPDNYRAFRARSYKWAYGCSSILRRWAIPVAQSKILTMRQKFFFFIFIGFYYTQITLLAYLLVTYVLMPLLIPQYDFSPVFTVLGGSLVIVLMYLPTFAYFLGNKMLLKWPGFAATVGLVYGSIDFVSARAIIDCALQRKRTWVPTNTVRSGRTFEWSSYVESAMGFCIIAIPYVKLQHLLYLPCTYLFALKFMAIPVLYLVYRKADVLPGMPEDKLLRA
jgi:cellulose synthase/poly-beta-1,6-N-acetylglucosamine synthase-like glycosyltransferase